MEQTKLVTPYLDPVLKRNRAKYIKLVRRCLGCGLLTLSLKCREVVGLFFVTKKDQTIRLITDCRASNVHFLDPPGVELVTGEGMSNIEVDTTKEVWGAEGEPRCR